MRSLWISWQGVLLLELLGHGCSGSGWATDFRGAVPSFPALVASSDSRMSQATQVPTTVGSVEISPLNARWSFSSLRISSPDGFGTTVARHAAMLPCLVSFPLRSI